ANTKLIPGTLGYDHRPEWNVHAAAVCGRRTGPSRAKDGHGERRQRCTGCCACGTHRDAAIRADSRADELRAARPNPTGSAAAICLSSHSNRNQSAGANAGRAASSTADPTGRAAADEYAAAYLPAHLDAVRPASSNGEPRMQTIERRGMSLA